MVILHIANIRDEKFKGVDVVVPQHVIAQQKIEQVVFMNIAGVAIDGITEMVDFVRPFSLEQIAKVYGKLDLVVFHEVYYPEYLQISNELVKHKVPYIIVPHGCLTEEAQHKKRLKKWLGNLLLFNRYIKNAAAIQCLSEGELSKTKFGRKRFIATNGVAIPKDGKDMFHEDCIEIVYIGRLDAYHKGLDLLFSAISRKIEFLRENHCMIRIFGPDCNGEYGKIKRLISDYNVAKVVELGHEIYGTEKEEKLLGTDLFIQTSRFEGMPMGILEALSYGIPCLVTKGTTVGELIVENKAGWMAETDAISVAEILEKAILEKNNWKEMSENARNMIKRNFSREEIAKDTVSSYREIVKEYEVIYE